MDLLVVLALTAGLILFAKRRAAARDRRPPAPPPPASTIHRYTSNLGDRYTFDIQSVDDEYRAYILDQPSYRGRPADGESTHRLGLNDGRPYVCVAREHTPDNPAHARQWAAYWADQNSRYVRDGRAFS